MIKPKYFFTGAENRRYFCQLTIYYTGNEKVYSFQTEFDGENLNITKKESGWAYYSGRELYLDKWIAELGEQVDSGNFS